MLLDVSRLVWRWWRRGIPTGVDRVCLAYMEHFRDRARAVVQRSGHYYVLDPAQSQRLFDLLGRGPRQFRARFTAFAASAILPSSRCAERSGETYLNSGHTGLDEASLPAWIDHNGLRPIYFVHDLIPLRHAEFCRRGEREKHARRMENIIHTAAGVIGNSQSTIDDLADFAAKRCLPMPPAISAPIAGGPRPSSVMPTALDRPHFIAVGTIEGRKNHALLLRIWQRLARRLGAKTPLLLIVGQRGWEAAEALTMLDRCAELREHVRELGRCDDTELANHLAGARALLMPSFVEGFGLPVAEALQLGTPVIASDLAVYREFAGEIPTYLNPLDEAGWEGMILGFIGDSPERLRQRRDLGAFVAPSWKSHFATVESWLADLGGAASIAGDAAHGPPRRTACA